MTAPRMRWRRRSGREAACVYSSYLPPSFLYHRAAVVGWAKSLTDCFYAAPPLRAILPTLTASAKPRRESRGGRLDVAGERRADVARQHQRAGRGAMLQHRAAARPRLLGVRVLREIPVRVIDLQQMVKHVADEGRVLRRRFPA